MKQWKGRLILLVTAMIWGCSFVAQSAGMDFIGPWTFMCIRSFLGAGFLFLMMPLIDRIRGIDYHTEHPETVVKAGMIAGIFLCAASIFQQIGIQYTTAGKAGFLTAMYVVLVPVFSLFLGRKLSLRLLISIVLAATGLYLISISGSFSLATGDLYEIICAFLFAFHILVIDHFGKGVDSVRMSAIQFLTAGIICLIPMFLEKPQIAEILSAAVPVLYAGICSSGIAYTLQMIGQKYVNPSEAGILMSLESVFALLAGMLIREEMLSMRELAGCLIMFIAVLLAN